MINTMTYLIASFNINANGDTVTVARVNSSSIATKMDDDLRFADGSAVELEMQNMSIPAIVSAIPSFRFSRSERRN